MSDQVTPKSGEENPEENNPQPQNTEKVEAKAEASADTGEQASPEAEVKKEPAATAESTPESDSNGSKEGASQDATAKSETQAADAKTADASTADSPGADDQSKSEAETGASEAEAEDAAAKGKDAKSEEAKIKSADGKAESKQKPKPKPKPKDPTIFRAYRARRPVNGKILGVIKGGYEVQVGRAKAFCPHSQLDLRRIDDAEGQVGKTYEFRIAQLRRAGEDIVLSRRMLLEAEQEEQASAVRASLVEGASVQGKVCGLADFGAFVDLGAGVTGLVHLTELGWGRYEKPADAVTVGDVVQVKILKIRDDGKISLSVKKATEDPWSKVTEKYSVDDVVDVKLLRFADFGVFVELEPGIEGLAPAREMPPKPQGWKDGLTLGETVKMRITSIEPKRRRISLLPVFEGMEMFIGVPEPGQIRTARVQKVESFGLFLWLGPGVVGMMPNVLSGEERGTNMEEKYPVGSELEVEVVDVEQDGKRIRLAKPGHAERQREVDERRQRVREEKQAVRQASQAAAEDAASFGATLGDKLKAALKKD